MTIHVKPEDLIAGNETVAAPAAHSRGAQTVELPSRVYVQLLPFLIFCFGMTIAAIPMMLG